VPFSSAANQRRSIWFSVEKGKKKYSHIKGKASHKIVSDGMSDCAPIGQRITLIARDSTQFTV
jgi:hypothetical protein